MKTTAWHVALGEFRGYRAALRLTAVLSIAVFTSAARADLIALENVANYGTFSQLNAAVNGGAPVQENSCVPTSVANGLAFLDNTYNVPGLMQPGYGTVNQLQADMGTTANGTTSAGMVAGTATYIGLNGQNVSPPVYIVGGQLAPGWGTVNGYDIQNNTDPTAMQLYNWLTAGDAVQFWINWIGGGAHSVSLYGIDIANGGTTGTLSFIDPFGNAGSAVNIAGATFTTVGGQLYINGGYNGGAANSGDDPDNAAGSATGYIVLGLAEAVPEPSTFVLMLLSLALPLGASSPGIARRFLRA